MVWMNGLGRVIMWVTGLDHNSGTVTRRVSEEMLLVPRLCLGTHRIRGFASKSRRSLQGTLLPGSAWERGAAGICRSYDQGPRPLQLQNGHAGSNLKAAVARTPFDEKPPRGIHRIRVAFNHLGIETWPIH